MLENAEKAKKDAFQIKGPFIFGMFQLRAAEATASGLCALRLLQRA